MNHESATGNNNLKQYLFYNQVRVNVAVAIVLLRKTKGNKTSREAFISQIQSEVIKYWSEKQPKDGFKNKIIANLQERCVKDVINVLPSGNNNIEDTKVNDLMYIVRKSIGIDNTVSQRSDSDLEDGEETARNCEFLRLVAGLKNIVETKKPINFDKGAFKFASDYDDSGVDCDRTSSTLNCTGIFPASIVSVPSVKFRSITHSSDTDAALKVTLQKLFDFLQKTILKSAESSVNGWKDSTADLSVATIKTLTKDRILVDTISEFVSKIFVSIWNNQSVEITELQYQTFIFSKLLCHLNICTRLIEDLVLCLSPWCTSVEKIINNIDSLEFHYFISNGPLLLDLITLIIKKWYYYLKHDSGENNFQNDINPSTNIKDLWKAKWDLDEKSETENDIIRYNDYIRSLRRRIIKFLRRISDDFPLLCPQIYVIIEVLDNCKKQLLTTKNS